MFGAEKLPIHFNPITDETEGVNAIYNKN